MGSATVLLISGPDARMNLDSRGDRTDFIGARLTCAVRPRADFGIQALSRFVLRFLITHRDRALRWPSRRRIGLPRVPTVPVRDYEKRNSQMYQGPSRWR